MVASLLGLPEGEATTTNMPLMTTPTLPTPATTASTTTATPLVSLPDPNCGVVSWFPNFFNDTLNHCGGRLGGLKLSPDGSKLCVVANAESPDADIHCLTVERDPSTGQVVNLLSPVEIINTALENGTTSVKHDNLDIGLTPGPGGCDFYNICYLGWANRATGKHGQGHWSFTKIPPELTEACLFDATLVAPSYPMGIAFSPAKIDPNTGYGMMIAGAEESLYQAPLQSP